MLTIRKILCAPAVWLLGAIAWLPGCKSSELNKDVPADIVATVQGFGKNGAKFSRMINYFVDGGDSLKIKSCYFIVRNIGGLQSFKASTGTVETDVASLDVNILIGEINMAVDSSRSRLASGKLKFDDFCEYVLPYRIDNETVYDWRKKIRSEFRHKLDSASEGKPLSDSAMAAFLNASLNNHFKFVMAGNDADVKNFHEMYKDQRGNCAEMSKMALFAMRAYGIPVALDFVPSWGNISAGGHVWNVLINEEGKNAPFMGLEGAPDKYSPLIIIRNKDPRKSTWKRSAKVYRKVFSNAVEPLTGESTEVKFINNFFLLRKIDVTHEYYPTADILLTMRHIPELPKSNYAYLGIYQSGEWIPISWGPVKGDSVRFPNMTTEIMYMPLIFNGENFLSAGNPIYLDSNRVTQVCAPDTVNTGRLQVEFLRSLEEDQLKVIAEVGWDDKQFNSKMAMVNEGKLRSRPVDAVSYILMYWNNGWKQVGERNCRNGVLVFENVPRNGVYRITTAEGATEHRQTRPFAMKNNKQLWF